MPVRAKFIASAAGMTLSAITSQIIVPPTVDMPPVFNPNAPKPVECRTASTVAAVFTGKYGARVAKGYELLKSGSVDELLISGVGGRLSSQGLAKEFKVSLTDDEAERVSLDRLSTNTRDNAKNTASFVHEKKVCRLILITSDVHMPRAVLQMQKADLGVTLEILPVPDKFSSARQKYWVTGMERVKTALTKIGIESAQSMQEIFVRSQQINTQYPKCTGVPLEFRGLACG